MSLAIVCLAATASPFATAGVSVAAAVEPALPYPIPGREAGTTAFAQESAARRQASSGYPTWFRGERTDGAADDLSRYFFTELVGPKRSSSGAASPGLDATNLRMGTLVLKPGATYPAHNHPAREIYYVVSGEADWYVDDEKHHVTAGSIILHRPYAVHGWSNTSKVTPLKVVWVRWLEADEKPEVLDQGARLVNPELAHDAATAKPFAVPLPAVHSGQK